MLGMVREPPELIAREIEAVRALKTVRQDPDLLFRRIRPAHPRQMSFMTFSPWGHGCAWFRGSVSSSPAGIAGRT